jgi:hypothetical protein
VATLCNGDHLPPGTLGEQVADIYLGDLLAPPALEASAAPVPVTAAQLARYAGVYRPLEESWNLIHFEVRDGKLAERLGEAFQTFTHVGNGRFAGDGSPGYFTTFFAATGGAPARLESSYEGRVLETATRMDESALWRPDPAALAEYEGRYFSPDVDAAWRIAVRDGRLMLQRRGQSDLALLPVERDRFLRGFGDWMEIISVRIDFHRDAAGRITHLTASTPAGDSAVQGLRFDRIR